MTNQEEGVVLPPRKNKQPQQKPSPKKQAQFELFKACQARGDMVFDNSLVGEICDSIGFRNKFDVTKIDGSSTIAPEVIEAGYCIVHLGEGQHKFVRAAPQWFHKFEKINSPEIIWPYRKSVLNETDTSESNILSVGFNQRIIHDFLYEDIIASSKMYGARRTKFNGSYNINGETYEFNKLQMEIDLTTEYLGNVTIFEGKNKFQEDFAVYQLFHPFILFHQLQKTEKITGVKEINCCFLSRHVENEDSVLRLYLYTFEDPKEITSLALVKKAQYRLTNR